MKKKKLDKIKLVKEMSRERVKAPSTRKIGNKKKDWSNSKKMIWWDGSEVNED
jgi:hypothetical protein